jgi:plastocyanin
MPRTKSITIKRLGTRCVVSPALIVVAPGDLVKVFNTTGQTAQIYILELRRTYSIPPTVFGARAPYILTVPKNARPGAYHYVVVCHRPSNICITSGLPIIIVPRLG